MAISTNLKHTIYRNLYENTISTNPKTTIYRNLYKNTGPVIIYIVGYLEKIINGFGLFTELHHV